MDALTRERAVTSGGRDNSVRIWKIPEESQLVFNGHQGSIDCVRLINEDHFVSCGDDGYTLSKSLVIMQLHTKNSCLSLACYLCGDLRRKSPFVVYLLLTVWAVRITNLTGFLPWQHWQIQTSLRQVNNIPISSYF